MSATNRAMANVGPYQGPHALPREPGQQDRQDEHGRHQLADGEAARARVDHGFHQPRVGCAKKNVMPAKMSATAPLTETCPKRAAPVAAAGSRK